VPGGGFAFARFGLRDKVLRLIHLLFEQRVFGALLFDPLHHRRHAFAYRSRDDGAQTRAVLLAVFGARLTDQKGFDLSHLAAQLDDLGGRLWLDGRGISRRFNFFLFFLSGRRS